MIIPSSHRYTYIRSQPDNERYINFLFKNERRPIQSTPHVKTPRSFPHTFVPVLIREPTASPSVGLSDLLLPKTMRMRISQDTQMPKIFRMARITPTLLQVQSQALT